MTDPKEYSERFAAQVIDTAGELMEAAFRLCDGPVESLYALRLARESIALYSDPGALATADQDFDMLVQALSKEDYERELRTAARSAFERVSFCGEGCHFDDESKQRLSQTALAILQNARGPFDAVVICHLATRIALVALEQTSGLTPQVRGRLDAAKRAVDDFSIKILAVPEAHLTKGGSA